MPEREDGGVSEHPSLEILSAYVDGRVDDRQRAEIEAHLAACEGCYELVKEVVLSQADIDAVAPIAGLVDVPTGPPVVASATASKVESFPARRRVIVWTGVALAAAASLFVIVRSPIFAPRSEVSVAPLIAAVGDQRFIEARLSGGFHYGPLLSPLRSGSADPRNLKLLAAVADLEQAGRTDQGAALRHALGVGLLLVGETDQAVVALKEASRQNPQDAALLNDLGAAYLTRGERSGNGDDWQLASDTFQTALERAPDNREALFNKALALTRSGRMGEASLAWQAYLASDPDTQWSDEARRQLEITRRSR